MEHKIEILAPAGEMKSLMAAVNNGADAVYLGGSSFSARKSAVNFDDEGLKEAVEYAHLRGVSVYVALNTLIHEDELENVYRFVKYCDSIGVDALIVQDLGVIYMLRKYFPHIRIHASTQMTLHNLAGVRAAEKLGFERVVLSRELSFEEIKHISDNCKAELEVFGHGALCMCYSGQCLMSSLIGGRSGNRGACAQPCRLPYTVCDKDKNPIGSSEKYYMSLKDLCAVEHLDKFAECGIASLKIEGRMKSPEYVAVVTSVYDKYRKGGKVDKGDFALLENIFSRNGFTDGYFFGRTGRHMLNVDRHNDDVYRNISDDVHSAAAALIEKEKHIPVDVYVSVGMGEMPDCVFTCGEHAVTAVGDKPVEAAQKSETPPERIAEQISKLGGTAFEIGNITYNIDKGINIPIKEINNLRRNAVAMLEERILCRTGRTYDDYDYKAAEEKIVYADKSASVRTLEQAKKAYDLGFGRIYIPYGVYDAHRDFFDSDSDVFALMLPAVASDAMINKFANCSLDRVCVSNISQLEAFEGKRISANYNMNIYNTMAQTQLALMGADCVCMSPELSISQLERAACDVDREITVYGRTALMTVKNCLVKSASGKCGCDRDVRYLKDRKGAYFPFYTDTDTCTNVIYNSVPVYMGDRARELEKIRCAWLRFDFTDETPETMEYITDMFDKGAKLPEGTFTRGHYYRGVE